jgi:hypothetical protein
LTTAARISSWTSLGHAGLRVGNEADVALGQVRRLEPALIAGHVHQHHQQAADIAFGDRGDEIVRLLWRCDVHGVS